MRINIGDDVASSSLPCQICREQSGGGAKVRRRHEHQFYVMLSQKLNRLKRQLLLQL
jgi:hypothetical protein